MQNKRKNIHWGLGSYSSSFHNRGIAIWKAVFRKFENCIPVVIGVSDDSIIMSSSYQKFYTHAVTDSENGFDRLSFYDPENKLITFTVGNSYGNIIERRPSSVLCPKVGAIMVPDPVEVRNFDTAGYCARWYKRLSRWYLPRVLREYNVKC